MKENELKAKIEALNTIEDAYELAKTDGFTGTIDEFKALCAKAAQASPAMDLNDMDKVAGGGIGEVWNSVVNWCEENKELAIGIASGVGTLAVAAIGYGVYKYNQQPANNDKGWKIYGIPDTDPIYGSAPQP